MIFIFHASGPNTLVLLLTTYMIPATWVKKRKAEIKIRAFLASCDQTTTLPWPSWLLVVGLSVHLLLSALPIQPLMFKHATVLPTTTTVWLLTGWSICKLVPAPVSAKSTSSTTKLCSLTDASFTASQVSWMDLALYIQGILETGRLKIPLWVVYC